MALFGCHLCTSGAGLALLCYCHSCDLFKPVEQHYLVLHVSQTVFEVVWVQMAMLTPSEKDSCINLPLPSRFIAISFVSWLWHLKLNHNVPCLCADSHCILGGLSWCSKRDTSQLRTALSSSAHLPSSLTYIVNKEPQTFLVLAKHVSA